MALAVKVNTSVPPLERSTVHVSLRRIDRDDGSVTDAHGLTIDEFVRRKKSPVIMVHFDENRQAFTSRARERKLKYLVYKVLVPRQGKHIRRWEKLSAHKSLKAALKSADKHAKSTTD